VQAAKDAMMPAATSTRSPGCAELREHSPQARSLHRSAVDPQRELVVTCGATEAMMVAMMTVCDPGDRVGLFSPFYENYGADAILTGATPSTYRCIASLSI